MVDHELDTVGLVVAVDLLIGLQEELLEHGGGDEGGLLTAPVVVVEQHIGMQVLADALGQLQLPLGQEVDELVHLVGVLIEGHQSLLDAHQVVALLEQAGGHEDGLVGLVGGTGVHALADVPQLIGELEGGSLDVITPVLDVLDDDLLGGVDGEGTGGIGGEGVGDAPGVDHILVAPFQQGRGEHEGVEQKLDRLILVYQTVGIAAQNGLAHVFFCSQHNSFLRF